MNTQPVQPGIEELLRPRIKVLALWPFCRQHNNMEDQPKIGEVFYVSQDGSISNDAMTIMSVDKYPHLFRKLEWWEERTLEQMPEYVKVNTAKTRLFIGNVHKVLRWDINPAGWFYCRLYEERDIRLAEMLRYEPDIFLPTSEQDYNNYINSQNPTQ